LAASLHSRWPNPAGALSSTKAGKVSRAAGRRCAAQVSASDRARDRSVGRSVPPDPRRPSSPQTVAAQRSINLAISSRGLAAIHAIDPDVVGRFLDSALPMRGRMLHLFGGGQHSQPYDTIHGQVRSRLSVHPPPPPSPAARERTSSRVQDSASIP
jgi:hypothetical protein